MSKAQPIIALDTPVHKIITHPGTAHRDDFIAACFAASLNAPIERRNPTSEELADPNVIVLDVGRQYDAALNNFDHHHDGKLPCSLTLFAQKLGLHETLMEGAPWYEAIDFRDRKGPDALADKLGVPSEKMPVLDDPVMEALLKQFSNIQGKVPEDFIKHVMKPIGTTIATTARDHKRYMESLAECEQRNIDGLNVLFSKPASLAATKEFCAKNNIDVVITTSSSRSENGKMQYSVTRTAQAANKFSFHNYENEHPGDLVFVHADGFMLVAGTEEKALDAVAFAAAQAKEKASGKWQNFVGGQEQGTSKEPRL